MKELPRTERTVINENYKKFIFQNKQNVYCSITYINKIPSMIRLHCLVTLVTIDVLRKGGVSMRTKWSLLVVFLILILLPLAFWLSQPVPTTQSAVTTEPVPEPTPPEPEPMILAAVGDLMLARKTDRLMQSEGLDYPLAKLGETLAAADLTFGNLESPLGTEGTQLPGKGIWFRARPETLQVLKDGGFNILNIANNHILDYDTPALVQTMGLLTEAGISYVGGGINLDEARKAVILESKGISLGFLGYSDMADIFWSYKYPRRFKATADQAGVAPLVEDNAYLVDEISQDIQKLKPEVDLVIVSLHWGTEYSRTPTVEQRQVAHQLIDAGADIILGHHPHVFQGLEVYGGGLIAYSLGNFVMDQNWSRETCQGLLLQITITKEGWQQAEILPVQIVEEQPREAEGKDADITLAELKDLSQKLDTEVVIEEGKGLLNKK